MKKIIKRFISLFREIKLFIFNKFGRIFNFFTRIRQLFELSRTLRLIWSIIKIVISLNMLYSFPIPFLFEPLNVLANIFRDLVDNLASIYFSIYYWFRERIFGYPLPDLSIPKDETDTPNRGIKDKVIPKRRPVYELTEEEEEYLKRVWYKQDLKDSDVWYKSPYLIIGGLVVLSICAGLAYYYYFYTGSNTGGDGSSSSSSSIQMIDNRTENRTEGSWIRRIWPNYTDRSPEEINRELSRIPPVPTGVDGAYPVIPGPQTSVPNSPNISEIDRLFDDAVQQSKKDPKVNLPNSDRPNPWDPYDSLSDHSSISEFMPNPKENPNIPEGNMVPDTNVPSTDLSPITKTPSAESSSSWNVRVEEPSAPASPRSPAPAVNTDPFIKNPAVESNPPSPITITDPRHPYYEEFKESVRKQFEKPNPEFIQGSSNTTVEAPISAVDSNVWGSETSKPTITIFGKEISLPSFSGLGSTPQTPIDQPSPIDPLKVDNPSELSAGSSTPTSTSSSDTIKAEHFYEAPNE